MFDLNNKCWICGTIVPTGSSSLRFSEDCQRIYESEERKEFRITPSATPAKVTISGDKNWSWSSPSSLLLLFFTGSGFILLVLGNLFGLLLIIGGWIFTSFVEDFKTKLEYHSLSGVLIYAIKVCVALIFFFLFILVMGGLIDISMSLFNL
jgi:hypothetical protein